MICTYVEATCGQCSPDLGFVPELFGSPPWLLRLFISSHAMMMYGVNERG